MNGIDGWKNLSPDVYSPASKFKLSFEAGGAIRNSTYVYRSVMSASQGIIPIASRSGGLAQATTDRYRRTTGVRGRGLAASYLIQNTKAHGVRKYRHPVSIYTNMAAV